MLIFEKRAKAAAEKLLLIAMCTALKLIIGGQHVVPSVEELAWAPHEIVFWPNAYA